jgi:hypothetical protein
VKWLISSRPEVELSNSKITGLLTLDAQSLKNPVNTYINHKLNVLRSRRGYNNQVIIQIGTEVRQRATNIFLWVALAFKQLEKVSGWDAVEEIKTFPEGLSKLYDVTVTRVKQRSDWRYCKTVLATTSLAHRPLSLSELSVLAGLPSNVPARDIVEECGSFYTIENNTVSLIHQSAKDYLGTNYTGI